MALDIQELLRPLTDAAPYGPDLRELKEFEIFRDLSASDERADWGRALPDAVALAGRSRDLRAWIWLARAALAAEGLTGLSDGLELIADGLDRYWDHLPPIDPDESDPRERYLGRLMALTVLGGSSYQTTPADLRKRRDIYFLSGELDALLASEGASAVGSIQRIEGALRRIEDRFKSGFGAEHDPQLGFELLREKLAAIRADGETADDADAEHDKKRPAATTIAAVSSRADVVRVLNLVLEYYASHEPASPVPLLVERAKRLVPMTFVEAMKELAPAGMKELQAVAGSVEGKSS